MDIKKEDFPQWVADQLRETNSNLSQLIGRVKALEFTVEALIATHPEPDRLLELWQSATPPLVEELADGQTGAYADAYHEGWQEGLGASARIIRAAAGKAAEG